MLSFIHLLDVDLVEIHTDPPTALQTDTVSSCMSENEDDGDEGTPCSRNPARHQ